MISGYLITSLLLAEHRRTGRIELRRFWLRRARRLLPALFLMIVVVLAVMVLAASRARSARLRGAALASLGYVANWHFVFAHVRTSSSSAGPSLLQHLWSLAVEEQFYLLWPPIFAAGLIARSAPRRLLAGVCVG